MKNPSSNIFQIEMKLGFPKFKQIQVQLFPRENGKSKSKLK